jgi:protein gp37
MAETTIQWTDYTFNPWVGCQRVSPGCQKCYAETYDKRVGGGVDPADGVKKLRWGPTAPRVKTKTWKEPLKWNRAAAAAGVRRRVFCASLADVFEDRPELAPWRTELFALIDATPHLDWLLLTKRPENIKRMLPMRKTPAPNLWLGATLEDKRYDRVVHLREVPAVVHFLSCEPLLEHVSPNLDGISWVIIGGESGGGARPFNVAWARSLIRRCREAGVAPFVKQLGANVRTRNDDFLTGGREDDPPGWDIFDDSQIEENLHGFREDHQGAEVRIRLKDRAGGDMSEWPLDLRVREFPVPRSTNP